MTWTSPISDGQKATVSQEWRAKSVIQVEYLLDIIKILSIEQAILSLTRNDIIERIHDVKIPTSIFLEHNMKELVMGGPKIINYIFHGSDNWTLSGVKSGRWKIQKWIPKPSTNLRKNLQNTTPVWRRQFTNNRPEECYRSAKYIIPKCLHLSTENHLNNKTGKSFQICRSISGKLNHWLYRHKIRSCNIGIRWDEI